MPSTPADGIGLLAVGCQLGYNDSMAALEPLCSRLDYIEMGEFSFFYDSGHSGDSGRYCF